jgi:hypothetical protein
MQPVAVQVQISKTGTSSVRYWLQLAQNRTPDRQWLCSWWIAHHRSECANADVWIGDRPGPGGNKGACHASRRPCRHFVTLREPISRLVSEYTYYCLQCREKGKFCGRRVHTGCGTTTPPTFVAWAERNANLYTRRFAAMTVQKQWYDRYLSGFANESAVTKQDVATALRWLQDERRLVLWTDTLSESGFALLALWLGESRVAAAASRVAPQHVNRQSGNVPWLSASDRQLACASNWADCELYRELRGASCAC